MKPRNTRAGRTATRTPAADAPEATPPVAAPEGAPAVITLKPKRQVTRYTVAYKGVTYESPRKALDAAGLVGYKGSQVRTVLKGAAVGTKLVIEGHEFTYTGAPVK